MSFCRYSAGIFRRCLSQNLYKQDVRGMQRWVAPTLRELQRRRERVGPEPIKPRSTYLEWNYNAEIYAFGKRLGEEFQEDTLRKALTHKSYVYQQQLEAEKSGKELETLQDNLELIKLGSVLISNYIQTSFEAKYSDLIVKVIHNYLTSESMLAHVGAHLGLKDIILCAEFPVENATLADTFKAVVAALMQSTNVERAEAFVKDFLLCQLNGKHLFDLWDPQEPYEHLERLVKEKGMPEVEPRLCNESGKNTILSVYQVGLYCEKKLIGIGWGESIEIAKNTAACDALEQMYACN